MEFKKTFRKLFEIFFLAIFMISMISCGSKNAPTFKDKDNLEVSYIDVGQGDSILVQYKDKSMLIDAGPNYSEKILINYLRAHGITKLDYVIATHPHEDHIGGMDKVIQNFKIDNMYMPKKVVNTKTFKSMIEAMKKANITPKSPKAGSSFSLGDVQCKILAPNSLEYKSTNNYSIVLKVTYGKNSFLFTGDAERLSEKEILSKGFDISCDVLKLGHHGSRTSTSDAFLRKVNPKYAIANCEKRKNYIQPHREVMQRLKKYNIKLYRTDECKTIIAESDGVNIKFNKKYGTYNEGERK